MVKIKFDTSKLDGRITEKCKSQKELAKKINMNPSVLSQKLSGKSVFSLTEAYIISKALEIPESEISAYFFTAKV